MKEKGPHSSRSQNYNVNGGPTMGGGSPKGTTGGKMGGSDTDMNATNVITKCGIHGKPYSPSANSQSKNR